MKTYYLFPAGEQRRRLCKVSEIKSFYSYRKMSSERPKEDLANLSLAMSLIHAPTLILELLLLYWLNFFLYFQSVYPKYFYCTLPTEGIA
jgi:hypothetical protein